MRAFASPFPPSLVRCGETPTELNGPAAGVVEVGPDAVWYHYTLQDGINAQSVTFDLETVGLSEVWVGAYQPSASPGWCDLIWPNECPLAGTCWFLGFGANYGSVQYWPNDYLVGVVSSRTGFNVETASAYLLTAREDVGPNAASAPAT